MDRDILAGKWKQIRGEVKRMWGNITDNDLDRIDGHREVLAGVLQERFGWTKERTDQELQRFTTEMEKKYRDQY
jgi:uncharacterized protein YjbJ (UPF0337 family)